MQIWVSLPLQRSRQTSKTAIAGQHMQLLEYIRQSVYTRALRKRQAAIRRQSVTAELRVATAGTVGLFFHLADEETVLDFAERLVRDGKKVTLLAWQPDEKAVVSDRPFPVVGPKEVDWYNRPKSEHVLQFMDQPFDLLFCLNTQSDRLSDFIAVGSCASCKLGPVSAHPAAYDLMMDVAPGSELRIFIQQIMAILEKTNVQYHQLS